jgi:hypothetical protein
MHYDALFSRRSSADDAYTLMGEKANFGSLQQATAWKVEWVDGW